MLVSRSKDLEPTEDVRVNTLSQDHSRLHEHMSKQLNTQGLRTEQAQRLDTEDDCCTEEQI